MSKNQKGFGSVEGLLILVIVAILGFTGWYVWHSKSNADKNLNTAASTSFTAPITNSGKKPAISTNTNSSQSTQNLPTSSFCMTQTTNSLGVYSSVITAQNDYIDLSAVNLKVPATGDINNLLAVCTPPYNDGSSAASQSLLVTTYQFSTTTLELASSTCNPESPDSLGSLSIVSSQNGFFGEYLGSVGKYYLYYASPQSSCYANGNPTSSFNNLQQQESQSLIAALKETSAK